MSTHITQFEDDDLYYDITVTPITIEIGVGKGALPFYMSYFGQIGRIYGDLIVSSPVNKITTIKGSLLTDIKKMKIVKINCPIVLDINKEKIGAVISDVTLSPYRKKIAEITNKSIVISTIIKIAEVKCDLEIKVSQKIASVRGFVRTIKERLARHRKLRETLKKI